MASQKMVPAKGPGCAQTKNAYSGQTSHENQPNKVNIKLIPNNHGCKICEICEHYESGKGMVKEGY